jgi:hypothetical protein
MFIFGWNDGVARLCRAHQFLRSLIIILLLIKVRPNIPTVPLLRILFV